MRVAVSQFATTLNSQENLATCIRIITKAAECKPQLIVLPEFCNTLPCYKNHNQAWDAALTVNGDFLKCISEQAIKHSCYLVLNVTLRRDLIREHQDENTPSNISVTSCLFSPLGQLIHQKDKQSLTINEQVFFTVPSLENEVITTEFACIGMMNGQEDMTFESSRRLALDGAELLCHSMSTAFLDQTHLHNSARACENNVFFISANKIGHVFSDNHHLLANANQTKSLDSMESGHSKSSKHFDATSGVELGIGQSQIISPNGTVLAKIAHNEEGFTYADIDLSTSGFDKASRPDGTMLLSQHRPELYQLAEKNIKQNHQPKGHNTEIPLTANVALFATYKSLEPAIDDVCHYIENNLSDIIQLPELFFLGDKSILNDKAKLSEIEYLSEQLIKQVSAVLRPFQYVCTSLVLGGNHQAVLISEQGVMATQQQLHLCNRYQWTHLGSELKTISIPLEQGNIHIAMLTADDANIPEMVKIASLNGAHLLLVPFDIQAPCEVTYSLLSRAIENKVCVVAASREKVFKSDQASILNSGVSKDNETDKSSAKSHKSTGLIINLSPDSSTANNMLSQWRLPKFNGYMNLFTVKHQQGKITKAVVHPIATLMEAL
jgi:predicted amidohydrolase